MFDKAVLKLTGIYTAILLVVSVSFSVACYFAASNELNRPLMPKPTETVRMETPDNIRILIKQRDDEIRMNFLIQLIFINLCVVVSGAIISYFLAKRTLRPINEMMQTQIRFVSDASHELRTPLTAIQMENEVTLRDKSADKTSLRNQITSNLEEVSRLQELTDRLLKLSRNEPFKISEIEIKQVINDVISRVTVKAKSKKIALIAKGNLTDKIPANNEALTDILTILIDNAIKFSPKNSKIIIGVDKKQIFVRDEGPGITAEDLPFIFDRFYRAEKSRSTNGYGLGLSLAQNLAAKMNLKITVKNNKFKGTTFYVG